MVIHILQIEKKDFKSEKTLLPLFFLQAISIDIYATLIFFYSPQQTTVGRKRISIATRRRGKAGFRLEIREENENK